MYHVTGPPDYEPVVEEEVRFTAVGNIICPRIQIFDDQEPESQEQFFVDLSSNDCAVTSPSTLTVTIQGKQGDRGIRTLYNELLHKAMYIERSLYLTQNLFS